MKNFIATMEISVEELRKNYKAFSDEELIRLATKEVAGLRPEAIQIMIDEIQRRGLPTDLYNSIEAQFKPLTQKEIHEYCELIQNQACPVCGSTIHKLNAILIGNVLSFVFFTRYEKQLLIACPICMNRALKAATIKTLVLGWWGIPFGIFRTIQALNLNSKVTKQIWIDEPTEFLKSFVAQKVGIIEANKNNFNGLQSIIKYPGQ